MCYEKEIHQSGNRENCFRILDNHNDVDRNVRNHKADGGGLCGNDAEDNDEAVDDDDEAVNDDDDADVCEDALLYDDDADAAARGNHFVRGVLSYDDDVRC